MLPDFFFHEIMISFGIVESKRFNKKASSDSCDVYLSLWSSGSGGFDDALMDGAN